MLMKILVNRTLNIYILIHKDSQEKRLNGIIELYGLENGIKRGIEL